MEIEFVIEKMENNKPEKQKNKDIATALKKIELMQKFQIQYFFLLLTLLINTLYCNIKKLFHQLRFFYEKSNFKKTPTHN